MTRRQAATAFLAAASALLALMGTAGCSTTVRGTPVVSECARHDQPDCVDYEYRTPVGEEMILGHDEVAAAQQLCSLVDDATLRELTAGPFYRFVNATSGRCVIAAATDITQPRFSISVGAFPEAMQRYQIVDGNTRVDIAGSPAWHNRNDDGFGNREIEYTIATGTNANAGGVLFVSVRAALPRGVLEGPPPPLPQFDRHQHIAETFSTALRRTP